MMTHQNCLYCGKVQDGTQACGCYSVIETQYVSTTTYDIKPLYRQDLVSVAKQLPPIPNMNHEKMILDAYRNGGWVKVDAYIDFVVELYKEMGLSKPKKTFLQTINDFVVDCIIKIKLYLKTII